MRHRRREPARRPIEPGCPTWCETDHDLDVEVDGIRLHEREVSGLVTVCVTDNLDEGIRSAVEVVVHPAQLATPGEARRLALAVLDAADFIEGGAR